MRYRIPDRVCWRMSFFTTVSQQRWQKTLTFEHLDSHFGDTAGFVFIHPHSLGHHHLPKAALSKRLPKNQPETHTHTQYQSLTPHTSPGRFCASSVSVCYLSLCTSQRGSWGSSYSETPESIGEPLEDRREGRTSIPPECIDELESTDTCTEILQTYSPHNAAIQIHT